MSHTLLLIDDDLQLLRIMQEEFETRGYRVITTDKADQVPSLARAVRPDLIVLDVVMPGVDGMQMFQNIRQTQDTARIPIVFLTNVVSDKIYPLVAEAARTAHLKKPVDLTDLLSVIEQFIQQYPVSN